jgi:hypothetical protein
MNLIQTIKVEIERKATEHTFSLIFFALFFLLVVDKSGVIALTFFLAYAVFPEELVKSKVSYLLKLPYKKLNLFMSDYVFGVILAIIPMLIMMAFFGFALEKILFFIIFYTAFFSIQTMISLVTPRGSLILLFSFFIFLIDGLISSTNRFYAIFSITSATYYSLIYVAGLFVISYVLFKKYYKG